MRESIMLPSVIVDSTLGRLTVGVTGWWAGRRDNAALTGPTPSHANGLKTRRLPSPYLHRTAFGAVQVWPRRSSGIGCIIPVHLRDAVLARSLCHESRL